MVCAHITWGGRYFTIPFPDRQPGHDRTVSSSRQRSAAWLWFFQIKRKTSSGSWGIPSRTQTIWELWSPWCALCLLRGLNAVRQDQDTPTGWPGGHCSTHASCSSTDSYSGRESIIKTAPSGEQKLVLMQHPVNQSKSLFLPGHCSWTSISCFVFFCFL